MAQLQFKGKPFVQNYHQLVKYHQLVPRKDKSSTKEVSLKDNLIIHGDNLAALKALMPQYAGKVKCIYIDPPYNTGNEGWVYNDNLSSPMMQEWLGKVVDREDLTRHDKWLCMMTPRLKLLRELLREDGVIFISIDDNEVHHLRMLMDEIFGEENFVSNISWEKRFTRSNNAKLFATVIDRILVYRRSEAVSFLREQRTQKSDEIYSNPDNDVRGPWTSVSYVNPASKEDRPNLVYRIKNPFTKEWVEHPTNAWKYEKSVSEEHQKNNVLFWGTDGAYKYPRLKKFLTEVSAGLVPVDLWSHEETGTTDEGSRELEVILGRDSFENPKPTRLLNRILRLASSPDSIVLDSFAGSGTIGHAVLALNKEDAGNRKFILVQCDEQQDGKTVNICETITAERVRRVIKGVPGAKDENLRKGLGGSFSYFDLGEPIDVERLLTGKGGLPSYKDLARYLFYTATGEEFDEKTLNPSKNFVGESKTHALYLFYEPNLEKLKNMALGLDDARALKAPKDKRLMVFAPTKYLDQEYLDQYKIDFVQLPYEIYKAFG